MKVAVIANDDSREELLAQGLQDDADILWLASPESGEQAATCIDLLFDGSKDRLVRLQALNTPLTLVNFVVNSREILPANFIAFNGWKGFLKRNCVEASCTDHALKEKAVATFSTFQKKMEWVPDQPGFIAPRVISMIINEAYLALQEAVSTKEEIDIAMKLGTNYPYGPFEWSRLIGLKNVYELLLQLAQTNSRYQPSRLLQEEAMLP